MLFKSLRLKNFMQYKGDNVIEFSCDPEKNITVIIGDNTGGKTTIAQSIRWLLYGDVPASVNYSDAKPEILNYEILEGMTTNDVAPVAVELTITVEDREYLISRKAKVKRHSRLSSSSIVDVAKTIMVKDPSGSTEGLDPEKFDEAVNTLLPKDLSQCFLFDGERWNNESLPQNKRVNIKESVQSLIGLSAIRRAMYHLREMGNQRSSVIGKLWASRSASDGMLEKITQKINEKTDRMDKIDETWSTLEQEKERYQEEDSRLSQIIADNRATADVQRRLVELDKDLSTLAEVSQQSYWAFQKTLSREGFMYLAAPMIKEAVSLLKKADVDSKGIPHMSGEAIDYIIRRRRCICGAELREGSDALRCIEKERQYLPPASIGVVLRTFSSTGQRWLNAAEGFVDRLKSDAVRRESVVGRIDEKSKERKRLADQVRGSADVGQYRRKQDEIRQRLDSLNQKLGVLRAEKDSLRRDVAGLEKQRADVQAKSEADRRISQRIDYAVYLYEYFRSSYERNESQLLSTLNKRVRAHFQEMFNIRNKYPRVDSDYRIRMYLSDTRSEIEAGALSEGEKVARNFAYIASIIEYARERRDSEELRSEPFPLVLDAPFSRLGEENIGLIARALPRIAEQLIVLVLEKDWRHAKQDSRVGAAYRLVKSSSANHTVIQRCI